MPHLTNKERRLLSKLRKKRKEGPKVYTGELPKVLSKTFASCFKGIKFKSHEELRHGDLYITRYKGRVAIVEEIEIWNEYHIKEDRVIQVKTVKSAYALCEVINPTSLQKGPWGYSWERWVPEVYDKDLKEWRKATQKECENWSSLRKEERRVLYVIGILPDEILEEWDYLD